MRRLNILGEYEEAELVAARLAACQMGFLERSNLGIGGVIGDEKDSYGNILVRAEPGSFPELPPGVTMKEFRPDHPTSQFYDFVKSVLRGAASGLDISYGSISGDMSDANYSSMRVGLLEERDTWRTLQRWFIQNFHQVVFEDWVKTSLLTNTLSISAQDIDRIINSAKWQPRGWQWVDPLKDADASILSVNQGLTTRSDVVMATKGMDLEDLFIQLKLEKELAVKYGLEFITASTKNPSNDVIDPKPEKVKK
jgi:lambda family phage portal protein